MIDESMREFRETIVVQEAAEVVQLRQYLNTRYPDSAEIMKNEDRVNDGGGEGGKVSFIKRGEERNRKHGRFV